MPKILIVDDESNIRLMLRLALKADGHEIEVASDGPEALALFGEGGNFDLVLLDQRMPGMEGLEVLKAMRAIQPDAKIVMATAFGTVDLVREAMAAGASGFLRKPFVAEVLRAAVVTTLRALTPPKSGHNDQFDTVSVNGFRLEALGDGVPIGRHEFKVHGPHLGPSRCIVELPQNLIEQVKSRSNRNSLQEDHDFWRWLSEEALANYIWQNAAPPEEGHLLVSELTSNLTRWMNAVLAKPI